MKDAFDATEMNYAIRVIALVMVFAICFMGAIILAVRGEFLFTVILACLMIATAWASFYFFKKYKMLKSSRQASKTQPDEKPLTPDPPRAT